MTALALSAVAAVAGGCATAKPKTTEYILVRSGDGSFRFQEFQIDTRQTIVALVAEGNLAAALGFAEAMHVPRERTRINVLIGLDLAYQRAFLGDPVNPDVIRDTIERELAISSTVTGRVRDIGLKHGASRSYAKWSQSGDPRELERLMNVPPDIIPHVIRLATIYGMRRRDFELAEILLTHMSATPYVLAENIGIAAGNLASRALQGRSGERALAAANTMLFLVDKLGFDPMTYFPKEMCEDEEQDDVDLMRPLEWQRGAWLLRCRDGVQVLRERVSSSVENNGMASSK